MNLRRAVSRSPFARLAAFPKRLWRITRHNAAVFGTSMRWLFTSREHHNFTYDLTELNRIHLAWFISTVCRVPVTSAREWMSELESDVELREHILRATAAADRRGLADREVRYARRLGWYAMIRARKPQHVVETGVDKGLGTCVIAAALLRNAAEGSPGRVTSMDINPEAGYLAKQAPWSEVVDLVIGDSIASLSALDRSVDLFLHDSDHSTPHERREFTAVRAHLSEDALLISDNVTETMVLPNVAEATGRQFLAYYEQPLRHWYPGDGIGAAWRADSAG